MSAEVTGICRIGLVGHGMWSRMYLAPGLVETPGTRLVALCGSDRVRARRAAEEMGIAVGYDSVADMIGTEELDAVVIASPPEHHRAAVEVAAAAGIGVFCEKPLGRSAAETAGMVAAVAGLPSMTGFTLRWNEALRGARDAVRSGAIGEPRHVRIQYLQSGPVSAQTPWSWHFESAAEPHGVLSDLGPHAIDLARWVVGAASSVSALGATVVDGRENYDECHLHLRSTAGWTANISCSRVAPPGDAPFLGRLEVLGSDGWVSCDFGKPDGFRIGTRDGAVTRLAAPGDTAVPDGVGNSERERAFGRLRDSGRRQMGDFVRLVTGRGDRTDLPTFLDAHEAQRVIDAAAESIRRGCWVDV